MGLFDRFKDKSGKKESNVTNAGENKSALYAAISELKRSQSPDIMRKLSVILKEYVDTGVWVPIPTVSDGKGNQLRIINTNGKSFAAIYSDPSEVKANTEMMTTDINKLLDPVFENTEIAGIIIDPDTTSLCIEKGFFLKCILHGYLPSSKNGGTPQRDWGKGIPAYKDSDLMSEGELLNFAMHTVLDYEETLKPYHPVSACDHPEAIAHLVFEDEGQFILVYVKGYCAFEKPPVPTMIKDTLLDYSRRFNAMCYYAPVGFGSTDEERFGACLALKGDGFYANYRGLEPIE